MCCIIIHAEISLDSNGRRFGKEGMAWISEIVTSRFCNVVALSIEQESGLNDACLQVLCSAFETARRYISHNRNLSLKKMMLTCSAKSPMHSKLKENLLKYSNVDEVRLNNMLYRLTGTRSNHDTPGAPDDHGPAPKWEFVLYVLQDF